MALQALQGLAEALRLPWGALESRGSRKPSGDLAADYFRAKSNEHSKNSTGNINSNSNNKNNNMMMIMMIMIIMMMMVMVAVRVTTTKMNNEQQE